MPIINIRNRTALYLRISTPDQKPDLQFDGLRRYAERAGLEIVGEYLDTAVSGPACVKTRDFSNRWSAIPRNAKTYRQF